TPHGKIDRKKLVAMEVTPALADTYEAPRNELEQTLATIWHELLGVEHIGINDNFFELGGHSLLAIRVISALRKTLEREVGIKDLFDHPTIAGLAACLSGEDTAEILPPIQRTDRPQQIPLS